MELKEKYTIVIVTHNMQQAVRISDRTAFFLLGELVEADSTEKIFSTPEDKRTEDYITGRFWLMRSRFDEQLAELNKELIEMGALCEEGHRHGFSQLTAGDTEQARKVAPLDAEIDQKERSIESMCLKLRCSSSRWQGSAADFRRPENDYGYGAHRRSGGGHCGNHLLLNGRGDEDDGLMTERPAPPSKW